MAAPKETQFDAREANSSAIMLSVLVLATGAVSWLAGCAAPSGALSVIGQARMALSAVVLVYLAATHRPSVARVYCTAVIISYLATFGYGAVRWHELGRPWEAFAGVQVGMVATPLVVPRSYRVALATVLAFALEALAIFAYLKFVGTPQTMIHRSEPITSLQFAVLGIVLVALRHQRRKRMIRYLQVEAEAASLEEMSGLFRSLVAAYEEPLRVLRAGVTQLRSAFVEASRWLDRLQKGADRIATVSAQLSEIAVDPAAEPTAKVDAAAPSPQPARRDAPSGEAALSRPAASPPEASHAAVSESERRFLAGEAQSSAMVQALIFAIACTVTLASMSLRPNMTLSSVLVWALQGIMGVGFLLILYFTRDHPSEARGILFSLLLILPQFLEFPHSQARLTQWQAFEPLGGAKFTMTFLALLLPRYWWLGLGLEATQAVEALAVYRYNHLDALKDRIPLAEPWLTLLYCAIGIAFIIRPEHRLVASVRLLRTEMALATLLRRTGLTMALLDQLGSPLQLLVVSVEQLRARHPEAPLKNMEEAVQQLVAASRRVPRADPHAALQLGESSRGARDLVRRE